MNSRRAFLGSLAALSAARAWPALAQPRFARDPFALGVASGYPTPHGVVLWTRLLGDFDPVPVAVDWEVAEDDALRRVVARGSALASPDWAHAVHVEAGGLRPGRWYWYRFRAGGAYSPVGRTRTAPPANDTSPRLRLAFASCQHYEQGYFNAHRHIAADTPDLVAFLGDYIYESSWGQAHVRKHTGRGQPHTLAEYRERYALYKSDADLQASHAAGPWIVTWDDHEVVNDYAGARAGGGRADVPFIDRRTAAYRAFYEHMPLPARMRPGPQGMRIYTELDWGALARFVVLDARQHRAFQACRQTHARGAPSVDVEQCAELHEPGRSMLGEAQERWMEGVLARSPARWNILAQQTPMAQYDQRPGPGRVAWTDGWDGYPHARRRLLDFLATRGVRNPVVLGGDVHTFNVSDLRVDFDDPRTPAVASEFVSGAITSQSWAQDRINTYLSDNPHIKLIDSRYRGYARLELTPGEVRADLRGMASVTDPQATCSTIHSYAVVDGRPGAHRI